MLWRRNNPAASIHQLSLLSFPQSTLRAADGSLRFGQPVPKGCSAEHGERARSMSAAPRLPPAVIGQRSQHGVADLMASDREFERGQQVGPVDEALEPAGRDLGKLEDPFIAAGLQLDWSRRLRG